MAVEQTVQLGGDFHLVAASQHQADVVPTVGLELPFLSHVVSHRHALTELALAEGLALVVVAPVH